MSHFEDIKFLFWGAGPKGFIGLVLFILVAAGAIWWAWSVDEKSAKVCVDHGEKCIVCRSNYSLCEQDGGIVVRR